MSEEFDERKCIRIDYYDPKDKYHGIMICGAVVGGPLKQAREAYWHFRMNPWYQGCRPEQVAWVRMNDYDRQNDSIIYRFDIKKLKAYFYQEQKNWKDRQKRKK